MIGFCDRVYGGEIDVFCFSELSLPGYSMPGSSALATSEDGPEFGAVLDKFAETGMRICFEYVGDGRTISHAVVDNGRLLRVYSKTHLNDREDWVMALGHSLDVIRTSRAVLGIQIRW